MFLLDYFLFSTSLASERKWWKWIYFKSHLRKMTLEMGLRIEPYFWSQSGKLNNLTPFIEIRFAITKNIKSCLFVTGLESSYGLCYHLTSWTSSSSRRIYQSKFKVQLYFLFICQFSFALINLLKYPRKVNAINFPIFKTSYGSRMEAS